MPWEPDYDQTDFDDRDLLTHDEALDNEPDYGGYGPDRYDTDPDDFFDDV